MSTDIQRFAAIMREYLKAVDRVGTAPSSKSYKERVAKERELRSEVEAKLTELVTADEKDQEWLATAAVETPKPRKSTRRKSTVKKTPPSDVFEEPPNETPLSASEETDS